MSLPPKLAELIGEFASLEGQDKLELLLELSDQLPEPPPEMTQRPELFEPIPECQSPMFVSVDASDPQHVHMFFQAPAQAPTSRGFASLLAQGLDGESKESVLGVPVDFYAELGLADIVSPLRLRALPSMLARIKRQLRDAA